MNAKLAAIAAAAVIAAAGPAQAEGFYLGAFGGLNFLDEADGTADVGGPVSPTVEVESDMGWAAGAAAGYAFAFGLRAEAEVAYRMNALDRATLSPVSVDLEGDTTALSVMGNLWFDIPLDGAIRPFVGGGLGMAQVSLNDVEVPALGGGTFVDDSDWVFAYQLGGGVAFRIAPGLDLTAEYRYFGTENPDFQLEGAGAPDAEYEYSSHSVLFGFRYMFNPT
jgi:opacity protein-like surface antigen